MSVSKFAVPLLLLSILSLAVYLAEAAKPNPDIWNYLNNEAGGRVLDVGRGVRYGNMKHNNCKNEDNQKFRFIEIYPGYYKIEVKSTGLILEVQNFGRGTGIRVQTNDYRGWDNQLWSLYPRYSGYVQIRAKHSADCLDVVNEKWEHGAEVISYPCHGTNNQNWYLVPAAC